MQADGKAKDRGSDVELKFAPPKVADRGMTEEEADAWLAQPVPARRNGRRDRTISPKEGGNG